MTDGEKKRICRDLSEALEPEDRLPALAIDYSPKHAWEAGISSGAALASPTWQPVNWFLYENTMRLLTIFPRDIPAETRVDINTAIVLAAHALRKKLKPLSGGGR